MCDMICAQMVMNEWLVILGQEMDIQELQNTNIGKLFFPLCVFCKIVLYVSMCTVQKEHILN